MKSLLATVTIVLSSISYAVDMPTPQFGDIVRNSDGTIRYMFQSSEYMKSIGKPLPNGELGAVEYCASLGQHLPTAREQAQLSASLHAKGIIEVAQYSNEPGYYLVKATDPDGKLDQFYFNFVGYERPDSDLGNNWFWSSSVGPNDTNSAFVHDGIYGEVNYVNFRNWGYAVRCVTDR